MALHKTSGMAWQNCASMHCLERHLQHFSLSTYSRSRKISVKCWGSGLGTFNPIENFSPHFFLMLGLVVYCLYQICLFFFQTPVPHSLQAWLTLVRLLPIPPGNLPGSWVHLTTAPCLAEQQHWGPWHIQTCPKYSVSSTRPFPMVKQLFCIKRTWCFQWVSKKVVVLK